MLKRYLVFMLLIVAAQGVGAAESGFYMESKMQTNAAGKEPTTQTTRAWVSNQKARFEVGDSHIILRLDQKKQYILRPKDKVYAELPLEGSPLDHVELSVKETGNSKQINNFNAREAIVTMKNNGAESQQKVFYTQDAGIPIAKFYEAIMQFPPLRKAYEPFKNLNGIPVYSESTVPQSNATVVTELLKFEERPFDAQLFEVPEGFRKR